MSLVLILDNNPLSDVRSEVSCLVWCRVVHSTNTSVRAVSISVCKCKLQALQRHSYSAKQGNICIILLFIQLTSALLVRAAPSTIIPYTT